MQRKPETSADHFVFLYPSIYHETNDSLELSGLDRIRNKYKPIFTGRIDWTEKKVFMLESEFLRLDEPEGLLRFDRREFSFAHKISVYYVPKDEGFYL